jgi:deoxycytidine triphosphate deaminase
MILSGRDIQWYIEQKKLVITPIKPEQFRQNGVDLILKDVDLKDQLSYVGDTPKLVKGNFYLGVTNEYFEFPDDLMAFVELRSTWARKGIMLPPTIVDAGFKGTLTLEIVSFITQPVPIGERFAHLIFAKMTGPSIPYDGKYQGQRDITPAIRDK